MPLEQMTKQGDLPFNKAWVKKDLDWKRYQAIFIRPVNTSYLMESDAWKQNFRQGRMKEDAQEIAKYMEDRFRAAFASTPLINSGGGHPAAGFPDPGVGTHRVGSRQRGPGSPEICPLRRRGGRYGDLEVHGRGEHRRLRGQGAGY